jgi:hypothetical protein
MAERTKWDVIAERKRLKKENAAIRAGGGLDQSWQRFTFCRICGKKICVNNYEDHKVRLPKLRGVIVCPWCENHGGEFVVRMYKLVQKMASDPDLDEGITVEKAEEWLVSAMKIIQHSPETRRQRARTRNRRSSQEAG